MTPTPSIEIPAQEHLLQKHKERVERLSQQNRVIKICTDAGFLTTVEVGQYFMTKDTEEFSQFTELVTCREYTLPRKENHLTRMVGFEGTPRLDPYWKSQPVTCKVNTEWKSQLNLFTETILTRGSEISHGLNKLVTDLIDKEYDDDEQETSTTKTEVFSFASQSKAKAKPRRHATSCSSSRTVPILERIWAYPVAKRINTILRHGELPREEDGPIEFWRLKDDLQNRFECSQYWSDDVWKSKMAGGGGNKKRFQ